MKDSLKDFFDQNREDFDHREPSSGIWNRIEASLSVKTISLWNSVGVWRAAAIVLLSLCAYLFLGQNKIASSKTESAQVTSDFKDLDSFYNNQIAEKVELVSQFQTETGIAEDEVTQNLQKLEAMYQVLKYQMKTRPSQDVNDALVLNLLVRIDLLNQQLNQLEDRKKTKNIPVSS